MKKRMIAMALLLCMLLTACVPTDPTGSDSTGEPSTGNNDIPVDYPEIPVAEEPSIQIHYYRPGGDYDTWNLWLWEKGGSGAAYQFNYRDEFGMVAVYPLSTFGKDVVSKSLGFIVRKGEWEMKDIESDRFIDFSSLVMDENNYYHIYLAQGDENIYMDKNLTIVPAITSAYFSDYKTVYVVTTTKINAIALYENGNKIAETAVSDAKGSNIAIGDDVKIDVANAYEVEVTFSEDGATMRAAVNVSKLYASDEFNKLYYYDGELGAIYSAEQTEFKVWSPISSSIVLNIYEKGNGGETIETHEMTRGDKGIFSVTLTGDYEGKYYTYTVTNASYPNGAEIVDPYAKSAGLSGVRGMIVDFSKTNPDGWDNVKAIGYDRKELVVWETHVADVTSSKTWLGTEEYRKKFLGMIEEGTTYTENGVTVTTGFDHIKELGVNAVQLVPIFDQANNESNVSFNWGYNPLNYNVLEGAYSTDATDGYVRIREFKQLVQAYNEAGINIIMDVVYNHVSSANGSNFDVLMPGYYFRYTATGALSNGSGCGNETASENLMMRKFIIDSVCFWAEEYNLGGFRFDLMGLHDIETMNELAAALREINPDIVIYGEPWEGGTSTLPAEDQADQANVPKLEGVGAFNDQMRDALIKGGLNSAASTGWITRIDKATKSDMKAILRGLTGVTNVVITNPNHTVNYVTCHDNYTLYDRIIAAGIEDEETIRKMAVLANAVVLTSNGTSFMLAGEEFLRTKGGDSNSYESSYEVNELDYALKIKNIDVFENYKALIAFKINTAALHLEEDGMDAYKAEALYDNSVISITFTEGDREYRIIHANGVVDEKDAVIDFSGYTLMLDTLGETTLGESTEILPFQTIIAYKDI